jgi:hypothetical protein
LVDHFSLDLVVVCQPVREGIAVAFDQARTVANFTRQPQIPVGAIGHKGQSRFDTVLLFDVAKVSLPL